MRSLQSGWQRSPSIAIIALIFAAGYVMGNIQTYVSAINDTQTAFQPMFEAFDMIQRSFVEDIPTEDLVDGAINGLMESLGDQHSAYLTPESYAAFNTELQGEVTGIGVVIETVEDTNEIRVTRVFETAPAADVGVQIGDVFIEVDGKNVVGFSQSELANVVRGPVGTPVNITFRRDDAMINFTIIRDRFEVPNVTYEVIDEEIGYIQFLDFSAVARDQIDDALDALDVNSLEGLILDIRGNPGGLLSSAIDMISAFVRDDIILYESFADGREEIIRANGNYANIQVPVVVLVDEDSASASELLAGALQDYELATIMGEVTFGKGTVQTIHGLSNEGAIRVTIARWLTPDRQWIHENGVTPDIIIEWDPETPEEFEVDPQLQGAIDYLNELQ